MYVYLKMCVTSDHHLQGVVCSMSLVLLMSVATTPDGLSLYACRNAPNSASPILSARLGVATRLKIQGPIRPCHTNLMPLLPEGKVPIVFPGGLPMEALI